MSAYYVEREVSGIIAVCRKAVLGVVYGAEIKLHERGVARIAMYFDMS
jgi:hypothetical protein